MSVKLGFAASQLVGGRWRRTRRAVSSLVGGGFVRRGEAGERVLQHVHAGAAVRGVDHQAEAAARGQDGEQGGAGRRPGPGGGAGRRSSRCSRTGPGRIGRGPGASGSRSRCWCRVRALARASTIRRAAWLRSSQVTWPGRLRGSELLGEHDGAVTGAAAGEEGAERAVRTAGEPGGRFRVSGWGCRCGGGGFPFGGPGLGRGGIRTGLARWVSVGVGHAAHVRQAVRVF